MDKTVYQKIDDHDRMSDADSSALFEVLDCQQSIAPLDDGLRRLWLSMNELRRDRTMQRTLLHK